MPQIRKFLLAGVWAQGDRTAEIRNPYDGEVACEVAQADAGHVEQAVAFAFARRRALAEQPTGARRAVLFGIVAGLKARQEELARAIRLEAGKPVRAAEAEVRRAIETFTLAAGELSSFGGRTLPVDLDAASTGYECETRRFPAGLVVGIVPFNFPLNLGAHKVAPALAVGAPIILKPPPQAPSPLLMLGEIAQAAGAPPASLQVLPCGNEVAEQLATDARVRVLSFTGSARVGWELKKKAAGRVVLELGGNAAAIVCADADLAWAAERCALGAFTYAGQVCIKVQRLLVDRSVYAQMLDRVAALARTFASGDPASEVTEVGPLIDDASAARVERWIGEAVAAGATVVAGGRREGRFVQPTVLTDVPGAARVSADEVFGPVLCVHRFDDFDAALETVNDSEYGLQAGLFTNDVRRIRRAFHRLEVGGVIVNDYPTFRSDNYPYGGVKRSGIGREGVRAAMEELTEERVLVTRSAS